MLSQPELMHKLLETVDVQYKTLMALDIFGSSLQVGLKILLKYSFAFLALLQS